MPIVSDFLTESTTGNFNLGATFLVMGSHRAPLSSFNKPLELRACAVKARGGSSGPLDCGRSVDSYSYLSVNILSGAAEVIEPIEESSAGR